ncbi:MAG TPA: metallophosphoesterase [Actinomycetes bacterium]|nr:metallophosphoesterase [Actinomycetes bacterium]
MRIRRAAVSVILLITASLALAALTPPNGSSPIASAEVVADPVVAAVGDFACDPADTRFANGAGTSTACQQKGTSDALLADTTVSSVLGLGDFQYDCGDLADYEVSYTPTWGRVNDRMVPVAGNHEYKTGVNAFGTQCPSSNATATNFFNYFGTAAHPDTAGHFSFDINSWHFIGLNANCAMSGVGGCSAKATQTKWLAADLAANTQPCIAAFWHQPYYTGLKTGRNKAYQAWWKVLYSAGADVVLNGHVHNYQRFAAMNPYAVADPAGITQYIVGTGGEAMASASSAAVPLPVVWKKSFGYARFTLHATGWDMDFISSSGSVLDTSSGTCH